MNEVVAQSDNASEVLEARGRESGGDEMEAATETTPGDTNRDVSHRLRSAENDKTEGLAQSGASPAAPNHLKDFRIEQMMSKAELARKAGISVLTVDRIEKGFRCRMDTKRKLLGALGLRLSERRKVFKDD